MRNKIRCILLWLKKEIKAHLTFCTNAGCWTIPAYPCSVAGLKVLCSRCQSEACQALDTHCACCGNLCTPAKKDVFPSKVMCEPCAIHCMCLAAKIIEGGQF